MFSRSIRLLILSGWCVLFYDCTSDRSNQVSLFNGKDLTGRDTYLGPTWDSVQNKLDTASVPGLNNDPFGIFTAVQEDGKPAIRVSGEQFGGISTKEAFQNYHLTLEFKWGDVRWAPKKDKKRDSGLLYHAVGPHGADFGFWMRSQEFQIQEGDCGDYWGVAGGVMDVPAQGSEVEKYVYDAKAPLLKFSGTSTFGRRCRKSPDAEKPTGQWNKIDLYCLGDTAVHVVNGVTTMVLYHSRQDDGGTEMPLKKGKIQLQSEGAELFYRNLQVESIRQLPKGILP